MTESNSPPATWTRSEWIANPTESLFDRTWETVQKERVLEPKEEFANQVERALESASFVELTAEEFERYTGSRSQVKGDDKPYLVRAVMLEHTHGAFTVYKLENYIRIHYGCLGRQRTNEVKHPLIIILPSAPKRVFVTCHMVA